MTGEYKGKPPGWRHSQSCATCEFGKFEEDGFFECTKYPDPVSAYEPYRAQSWMVCDEWVDEVP